MPLFRKKRYDSSSRTVQLTIVEGNAESGDYPGKTFTLKCGDNFIGRDPVCEIVLNSKTVSRKHASLWVGFTKESFAACDLGSANGVIVLPSHVLKKNQKKELHSGDQIVIGEVKLRLLAIDQDEKDKTMAVDTSTMIEPDGSR